MGLWVVGALLTFALVFGAYFTFRFGGRWSESDTAAIVETSRAILKDATLLSPSGIIYPNGYAFGAVTAFIVSFTGIEVATLTRLIYPLVSATLVLLAWPLYRELTGSARAATLGVLLLFAQPEFIFVILRGSHERVLRALLFVSLFLLVRSFRFADRPRAYGSYVLLFYVAVYGVISTNSLFGSSYVWALGLALLGSWFGGYLGPRLQSVSNATRRRLIYAPLLALALAFLFNEYIYPPAGRAATQVPDILDRLSRLFLSTSPQSGGDAIAAYDPYAAVFDQWVDIRIYFLLSTGTYLLMVGSAFFWVRLGLRWLAGQGEAPSLGQWLLWLMYGAFALQGGLSILADRAGALAGNLQHRTFPSFVMVAAPLIALALVQWRPSARARLAAAAFLGLLGLFAIVKATNEPFVSNKWTFYRPYEITAMQFAARHQSGAIWWEFDERLSVAQRVETGPRAGGRGGPISEGVRTFLITDVTRLRASWLKRPLPPVLDELRVYDNGSAQIYRLRTHTPYQQ